MKQRLTVGWATHYLHAELQAVTQQTSESTYLFDGINTKIIGDLARNIAGWGEARRLAGISQSSGLQINDRTVEGMRGHKRKRQSEERSGGRCTAQPQT
ncbi:hypothetical protein HZ326_5143 [Fusarium oxysporum f. sp. albedinis]|jgi:hypothetical protein|nr:hypothetical protein HZ326_5143 [Fusarium oxysporum f. sp. albedinis]